MVNEWNFNRKYPEPSPDVQEKLRLSMEEARQIPVREMKCPVCGFPVARIPITQTEVVYVKCHKCKFVGVLSPAYFRRIKRKGPGGIQYKRRRMVR